MTRDAVARLRAAGVPDPARDVRRLRDWAFEGLPDPDGPDGQAGWDLFEGAVAARARRVPVSQITGRRAFWRHEFEVTPDVLDPRPDTETLVEAALAEPATRLLDLGTGSGCIALSVLADRPGTRAVATDASAAALAVARRNAARLGVADRVAFRRADWWDGVEGRFDLIASNPPYIAAAEMTGLAPELAHEPRMALTPGGDGLAAYRAIAAGLREHLLPAGRILLEIGPTQAEPVSALLDAAGITEIGVKPDLDGRDRVVFGRFPAV